MAKYSVTLYTTASVVIDVEADDVESAVEAAYENTPSQGWDWPDMGDWQTASEMFPGDFKPEDDAELSE